MDKAATINGTATRPNADRTRIVNQILSKRGACLPVEGSTQGQDAYG
jgi:hypothetical protein